MWRPIPFNYRPPLPAEVRTYELTGYAPNPGAPRFAFEDLAKNNSAEIASAGKIAYEKAPDRTKKQKRLIEHVRMLYRPDDFGASKADPMALLTPGKLEPRALPGESYKLALTPSLIAEVFKRQLDGGPETPLITDSDTLKKDGGYVHSEGDGNWWIPSRRVFFSAAATDDATKERTEAESHFFLPRRFRDPFGSITTIDYDKKHDLSVARTEDALGNTVAADIDYRVLQQRVTDPNGNSVEAAFDTLGFVAGMAVIGRNGEGDRLIGFKADLDQTEIDQFFTTPRLPRGAPGPSTGQTLLQQATTRRLRTSIASGERESRPSPRPSPARPTSAN